MNLPDIAEALRVEGNEYLAKGEVEKAAGCYSRAVAMAPDHEGLNINLGYALLQLGDNTQATMALTRAIVLNPQSVDAHYLISQARSALGEIKQARESLEHTIKLKPDFDFAHRDLAYMAKSQGQNSTALAHFANALNANPKSNEILMSYGTLLLECGVPDKALPLLQQLNLNVPSLEVKALLGLCFHDLFRAEEAELAIESALALDPNHLMTLAIKTKFLHESRRDEEALRCARHHYALDPEAPNAISNLGVALGKLDLFDEALNLHLVAATKPNADSSVYSNLSGVFAILLRASESVTAANNGIKINVNAPLPELHWRKAVGHFLQGELQKGWPSYEFRWMRRRENRYDKPEFASPQWSGAEALVGKSIHVYQEQGLGDFIQFVRYVPLLLERGAKVFVTCPDALRSVIMTLPQASKVNWLTPQQGNPPTDFNCPLLSLPLAFNTSLATIPRQLPYLFSHRDSRQIWHHQLNNNSQQLKVGLVWSGNANHQDDKNRSMTLKMLLTSIPDGVTLCTPQKDIRPADLDTLLVNGCIYNPAEHLRSFADTAALLTCLDLVITVDTSVAHLAGALGVPVWILVSHLPDWRWMLNRSDSPWYPSARLFRQHQRGDWSGALADVRLALEALQKEHLNLMMQAAHC